MNAHVSVTRTTAVMASTLLLRNELTLKEHCYKVIENSKSILKKKSHAIMAVFN